MAGSFRDGVPFVVEKSEVGLACTGLKRLSLADALSEGWLQEVLERSPELLPIPDIDERLELPLRSLGREVSTPAGAIDNLFLSRNGYLVLVETKLWRNPEARRQVVAQVVDYAAQVRKWRYENIERLFRSAAGDLPGTLWEAVGPDDPTESAWIDRVNGNLTLGRMTLVVAGDGIRSETEALAEAVNGHPDFQFRLALVELRVFDLKSGERLVVPATLARTAEIERAIVRITYAPERPRPRVEVETPAPAEAGEGRQTLSAAAFRDELRRADGEVTVKVADRLLSLIRAPLEVSWGAGSFIVKAPDPAGSGRMLSLCVVGKGGILYAYMSWLDRQLADLWSDTEAVQKVSKQHIDLLKRYGARRTQSGKQFNVRLDTLAGKEEAFVADLLRLVEVIAQSAPR